MVRSPLRSQLEDFTNTRRWHGRPNQWGFLPAGGGNVSFDVSGQIEEIFEAEADAAAAAATSKAAESEDDDMASGGGFHFSLNPSSFGSNTSRHFVF